MTGAKNFVAGSRDLFFALPRMPGLNFHRVKVCLMPDDVYVVMFYRISGGHLKCLKSIGNVYAEDLRGVFERETGIRTSLTAIYA